MKKLFCYLFKKPNIKVGDTLAYHNYACKRIYFDWQSGLWFLGCTDEFDISYNVEKYSIEKNQGAVKDEK